ncbi:glycoside hydrolase family 19 protein [Imhoffiella purpurea]|uniref:Glycoside hydrolase family 19 catalytic domain-containing protein n=1 Tax=Imhoffiella purpurea TaxID=1249627 RepID=W9VEV6_9GAMM|nr:glycoside hydrolase family 19 protein [Imhoffiella purpurea]EXJ14577.1 hypothetical protein D779_2369 [Imhoffiella purpurea]
MKLKELLSVSGPVPLSDLTEAQLMELQTGLALLGYPVGDIDGLIGPRTRNAWAEYKTDVFPGNPELIGLESIGMLADQLAKLAETGTHDFTSKPGTIEAIKWECKTQGIGLDTQVAYVLATTQWETAQTFEPVRESFWRSEEWRRTHFHYYPYYGRGFVQLTWKTNYEKYSRILGLDLVADPDIAMRPNIALFVLVHGFKTGTFTGRKISDYIDRDRTDFINARRCINVTDKAETIANIAKKYLSRL